VIVEPGVRTGVPLLVDNPEGGRRGPGDQHAGAQPPLLHRLVVVDFGTSTNIDVISAKASSSAACSRRASRSPSDALAARAAALRKVELVRRGR